MKFIQIITTILLSVLSFHRSFGQCMTCTNMYKITTKNTTVAAEIPSTVHKQVQLDFSEFQASDFPLAINLGDGNFATIPSASQVLSHTYGSFGTKNLNIITNNAQVHARSINLRSLNNSREYEAPDEILEITETFSTPSNCIGCASDPFTACNKDAAGNVVSKANAYIKFADKTKPYRKILVFVEGIDFNKTMKCNPLGGNKTIRYGDFGWDVFYMEHKADISWDFV